MIEVANGRKDAYLLKKRTVLLHGMELFIIFTEYYQWVVPSR